jgi:hypothetical protein
VALGRQGLPILQGIKKIARLRSDKTFIKACVDRQ